MAGRRWRGRALAVLVLTTAVLALHGPPVPQRTRSGADAGAAAGRPVAVRQGAVMATAFHPELTGDLRVHALFCEMVKEAVRPA